MIRKHFSLVFIFIVSALLLSSCGKLHITTTIKPDGSGENDIIFGLDTYCFASSGNGIIGIENKTLS
jgi:hypothetical protein